MEKTISRRPLSSRDQSWAKRSAAWLTRRRVSPNSISVTSTAFAAFGASFLFASSSLFSIENPKIRSLYLGCASVGVIGRMICNLLDGLVAVEGGLKTPSGEVFNDFPDRISDLLIIVAMGHAAVPGSADPVLWIEAGWAAAALAILTAYVRYLGAGLGTGQYFAGPMSKPNRMILTVAVMAISAAFEPMVLPLGSAFRAAVAVLAIGSIVTCAIRLRKIIRALEKGR